MHITRLRVEQFRQFRQPFELTGLEPGLNIITGPNEAGKSTLVRAIRAAFFDRHRSTVVDDLRPWGDSAATPTVELDFQLLGEPAHLVKTFLGKKRCALKLGARSFEGVDAEDHLADLLGFTFAGKGASKTEHWGIPGLLWVEQGTGQVLEVAPARDHLHKALSNHQAPAGADAQDASKGTHVAANLAASRGDAVLDALRAQRGELLSGTGKPRAALQQAMDDVDRLTAELRALDEQMALYSQQVDQLALLRQAHQHDDAAQPWEALKAQLAEAQAVQQALAAQEQQLAQDTARLQQLQQNRDLLQAQLQAHAQAEAALATRQQALAALALRHGEGEALLATARTAAEQAQSRSAAARAALQAARAVAQRHSLQAQQAEATATAERLHHALQRATTEHERLSTLRAEAAATAITPAQLDALRQRDRALRDATLQREAVATRLQVDLLPGQHLTLGTHGQVVTLQGQSTHLLDAPATLELPGVGRLSISPGGADLAELARDQAQAEADLAAALNKLGLPNLAAAEARLARHQTQQSELRLAEQALALVAPQGLDALRAALAQAQARVQAATTALQALPPQAEAASDAVSVPDAEALHDAAEQAERRSQQALSQAQSAQAALHSQLAAAQAEIAAAQAALADASHQARHATAQQQWLSAQTEHAALAARVEQAAGALRAARPDIVAQDIQRLQRSVQQLQQAHQQRRDQIMLLENTLQNAKAAGLGELREQAHGELVRGSQRLSQLQRRADALNWLCQRLDAKRQAALTRLQAPLQQHMQRYLQLLFPGGSVQIDEHLAPGSLTRTRANGALETGDVSALSFGAREQLGLISRFAYADLLQAAGRPTLLMLDDALVHSDDTRLAHMKRVIFDAAQRHQVLLFTCHPALWRDMGVAARALP